MLKNNLEENALQGKIMVYDELRARESELHLFEIDNHLRKSCRAANQRYKAELERKKKKQEANKTTE